MRRKKYIENKSKAVNNKRNYFLIFIPVLILIILLTLYFIYKLATLPKFVFLNRNNVNGESEIFIVDSKNDYIKKYVFSDELLVDSSYGYGEYNLKNLWILSEKEKLGGKLMATTISKNFSLPIYYFLDQKKTNMDILHMFKARIAIKSNLSDEGVIESKDLSKSTLADFVNDVIQENAIDVIIDDRSGNPTSSENIALIVSTLGSKVVDYRKGFDENLDCEIQSNVNSEIVKNLSNIFGCPVSLVKGDGKVVIVIGNKFSSRF